MKVAEVMSSPVEIIDSDSTVTQAAEIMKSFNIGVIPVEQDGEIVGVITDRDITVRVVAERLDPQKISVSKVMTPDVTCCSEDTEMDEAARLMEDKKIHRLLVLDSDNSPAGILSVGDIALKIHDDHILHEVLQCVCEQAHTF